MQMNKYLFIDESGDPGIEINNGASKSFTMVAVLFDDVLEMETVSLEIKKLSRKLFKNDYHEFHFVHEKNIHRLEFFKLISNFNFKILTSITDKLRVISEGNIYKKSLKEICSKIENDKFLYSFKFDGTVSKSYKFGVEKELRLMAKNNFLINKIKFANSKNDSLIQLADMCAGIIRRKQEEDTLNTNEMYLHIKDKIE